MLMGGIAKSLPYGHRRTVRALKHLPAIGERALGYRQPQVLAFIRERIIAAGFAPSYGEICAEFGIDRSNLSRMITSLERRGLVARAGAGRDRRLRLL